MRLVRLSQDMDISNPEDISYFLVFQQEDGEEERVPVPESTAHALIEKVMRKRAGSSGVDKEKLSESHIPEGASVFGDDEDEYSPREEEETEFDPDVSDTDDDDDGRFEVERSL